MTNTGHYTHRLKWLQVVTSGPLAGTNVEKDYRIMEEHDPSAQAHLARLLGDPYVFDAHIEPANADSANWEK